MGCSADDLSVYILVSMHLTACVSKCRKPAADFKKQVACIYYIDMCTYTCRYM